MAREIENRAGQGGEPTAPYVGFRESLSSVYPKSVIEAGTARFGPDANQPVTYIYAPDGIGALLSQADRILASKAQREERKSSGVKLFRTNRVGEKVLMVQDMWRKSFPGENAPSASNYELQTITFPDLETEKKYWEAAGMVFDRYKELTDELGEKYTDVAFKRLAFQLAVEYPVKPVQLSTHESQD